MDLMDRIENYGGEPVTSSRAVAEQFDKRHADVIRAIEEIIAELNTPVTERKTALSEDKNTHLKIEEIGDKNNQRNFALVNTENTEPKIGVSEDKNNGLNFQPVEIDKESREFAARNFLLTEYTDGKGEHRKQYILTRDGFTLLAMGFTGARAMQFKVAYITAFNRMEQFIKRQNQNLLDNAAMIKNRLLLVDGMAATGNEAAIEEITRQTLNALNEAINGTDVYIKNKSERYIDGKKCIGINDNGVVYLIPQEVYAIYIKSTTIPLAFNVWHKLLCKSGVFNYTSERIKGERRYHIGGTKTHTRLLTAAENLMI